MAVATLGLRGSGAFAADERPKNWRQAMLLIFPNGDAPLTALLSKLAEEPTDDPEFNWFEKNMPVQRGIIVGAVATTSKPADNAVISAADNTAEISLSVKPDGGSEDDLTWLTAGYVLFNEATEEVYLITKIQADYITVRRDIGGKFASNPAVTGNATTGDPITVIGSAFQEGASVGSAITFAPLRHYNYTQIFRTPLSITRTARRTKLRWDKTGPYMEAKREALQIHSIQLERAFMFGEREEVSAVTNTSAPLTSIAVSTPLRTTRGLLNWMPAITSGAAPTLHWDLGTANTGVLTEILFDAWCEEVFRYGSSEKLVFAGSTALNVLNQMAKNKMTIQAVPSDRTYGMAFNKYITPFGDLMVKQHPLMSHNPTWRKDLVVIDTSHIKARVLDETTFLRNRQSPGDDASVDEYLTEIGLEVRFSGAVASSLGGLAATSGPGVHGRMKGIATFGG